MTATIHTLHPRSRRERDMDRGRRAFNAVRKAGGSAMDAALAQIDATFDEAAITNALKCRVEHFINLGTDHPAVRARYGERVRMIRDHSLDAAILKVEQWYRTERQAFQIAAALGRGNSLSIEVLQELRLILRLIRASAFCDHFAGILAFLLDEGGHDYVAMQDAIAAAAAE